MQSSRFGQLDQLAFEITAMGSFINDVMQKWPFSDPLPLPVSQLRALEVMRDCGTNTNRYCIFQPANLCCVIHLLVEICFLMVLPFLHVNEFKNFKKDVKTCKKREIFIPKWQMLAHTNLLVLLLGKLIKGPLCQFQGELILMIIFLLFATKLDEKRYHKDILNHLIIPVYVLTWTLLSSSYPFHAMHSLLVTLYAQISDLRISHTKYAAQI